MWRLTLAQMRRSLGRLTAAGIAVAIGTAFVAATLLAGDVMQRISYDSITAQFGTADLVANTGDALTDAKLDAVRGLPGVAAADPMLVVPSLTLSAGDKAIAQALIAVPSSPAFDTEQITSGEIPTAEGEISLPERAAERLGVGVGDEVVVDYVVTGGDDPAARSERLEIVGLSSDPTSAWARYGGAAMAIPSEALTWAGASDGTNPPRLADAYTDGMVVELTPGADTGVVQQAVTDVLAAGSSTEPTVLTREDAAEKSISNSGTGPVLVVVLSFAAVAMLVAGLVIANTFQVLVAQRARTLALLRCVGAVRSQVRRSVLLEATLVGTAASVVGAALGTLLVQIALWIMGSANLPFPVPSVVHPTAASILAPLVVGVVVTVLAALTPARVATRVAPIAALRPSDAPAVGSRAGRVRLVLSVLLVLGGGALLAGGVAMSLKSLNGLAILIAILGGALSFVGILVSAVFWMPKVVAGIGSLVGRTGMPARLAAANTGRNPTRTAATSTALLIGVTLVAMMSTGALTARSSLDGELDNRFPVDVDVSSPTAVRAGGRPVTQPLPAGTVDRLARVDGITAVAAVASDSLLLGSDGSDGTVMGTYAVDPADALAVMRDPRLAEALTDDTIVLPASVAASAGLEDGDSVPVALGNSDTDEAVPGAPVVERTVRVVPVDEWAAYVTPATFRDLDAADSASAVWLRVADVNRSGTVVQDVQDITADSVLDISGAAVERAVYQRAIDTVLAVVIGLLGVAVVIALIGVTNTLSLSVIERRRESATLRALGLTRRQLRTSMAVEGALISGVGAVVGVVLGVVYGWLGSTAVLAGFADLHLGVPWPDLGLVLVVALGAGVLASVVPGRTASRTPPVAALAVD
jgi:putative ABC transport system permease protein